MLAFSCKLCENNYFNASSTLNELPTKQRRTKVASAALQNLVTWNQWKVLEMCHEMKMISKETEIT